MKVWFKLRIVSVQESWKGEFGTLVTQKTLEIIFLALLLRRGLAGMRTVSIKLLFYTPL